VTWRCLVIVGTFVFLYCVRYSAKLGYGGGELYQLTLFESAVIDGIRSRLKDAGRGCYKEVGTDAPGNDMGIRMTIWIPKSTVWQLDMATGTVYSSRKRD